MNVPRRIPNLDTVSAFVDRLVVEHIKRFEFARRGDEKAVALQDELIVGIRARLSDTLVDCLEHACHAAFPEVRDFLSSSILPSLEGLIASNALLGLVEHEKLAEAVSGSPDVEALTALVVVARIANERRAMFRNSLDIAITKAVAVPNDAPSPAKMRND